MTDAALPLAGVELGGTKCICILGTGPDDVRAHVTIATTAPQETQAAIADTLRRWTYRALGIASFGPLDLNPASPDHGCIVNTTKPGWSGTSLLTLACDHPCAIDTDVNGAALAEGLWGGAQGLDSWAYVTVGTGIGVGTIIDGKPARGLGHSEAGHMRIPHDPADGFPGLCSFHGDCVEGMASGPAIEARGGMAGRDLAADHPAWGFAAGALAAMCHNLVLTSLPGRILIGGGVATGQPQMLSMIRARLVESLAGYGGTATIEPVDRFISAPALGTMAGPMGALALAHRA